MWCVVRVMSGVWRLGHDMFDVVRITRGRVAPRAYNVLCGAWCVLRVVCGA